MAPCLVPPPHTPCNDTQTAHISLSLKATICLLYKVDLWQRAAHQITQWHNVCSSILFGCCWNVGQVLQWDQASGMLRIYIKAGEMSCSLSVLHDDGEVLPFFQKNLDLSCWCTWKDVPSIFHFVICLFLKSLLMKGYWCLQLLI